MLASISRPLIMGAGTLRGNLDMKMRTFSKFVLLNVAFAAQMFAQQPTSNGNKAIFHTALQNSVLIHGHQPFHLMMKIAPAHTDGPHVRPAPLSMQATLEIFWAERDRYKLLLHSPSFEQTKVVDGTQIEEQDNGDFYPRWLDNFVEALLAPVPEAQLPDLMTKRLTGGGSLTLPGRPLITMPRCAETSDRPGGITEETSIARICFDASHPWFQGMLIFTSYVSFADFEQFGTQMIPRTWSDDIPENIFVEGKVTLLEKLSAADLRAIHISKATPLPNQIRTVFLSRKTIEERIANVPDYVWPPKDTGALEGYMIVYVRTDRSGQVRESYWDSSDNYGLQDAGVALALKSSLKPMLVNGSPVQMEGPLILHFKTSRNNSPSAEPVR
jgi:hypothetical protein